MGHQFSYYLTKSDTRAAIERICRCGDYVILHSSSPEPKPRILPDIDIEENGQPWLFLRIARREDLELIRMAEVPEQHHWTVDDQSPVIEFGRCYLERNYLRKARIYYQPDYLAKNSHRLLRKSEAFLDWAKCVFTTMKRNLTYDSERSAYIGQDALDFMKSGGVLVEPWEKVPGEK
jgi:hypothetical protein